MPEPSWQCLGEWVSHGSGTAYSGWRSVRPKLDLVRPAHKHVQSLQIHTEESPKLLYLGVAALRSRLAAVSRASPLMVMPPFASLRADTPKSLGPRKGKVVFGYGLWMDLIIGMTLLES